MRCQNLVTVWFSLALAACADPTAVRSFAEQAPSTDKFRPILAGWAATPSHQIRYDLRGDLDPVALRSLTELRAKQVQAFATVNDSVVAYMQALGALAEDKLVQVDTGKLNSGLSALKSAGIGITDPEVAAVTTLVKLVGEAAAGAYRAAELSSIIGRANDPFQQIVTLERRIIVQFVIPDIAQERQLVSGLDEALVVSRRNLPPPVSAPRTGASAFRGMGGVLAAETFLMAEKQDELLAQLDARKDAAQKLATILGDIAAAHQNLHDQHGGVLTKSAYDQIKPLIDDARSAYAAVQKL